MIFEPEASPGKTAGEVRKSKPHNRYSTSFRTALSRGFSCRFFIVQACGVGNALLFPARAPFLVYEIALLQQRWSGWTARQRLRHFDGRLESKYLARP